MNAIPTPLTDAAIVMLGDVPVIPVAHARLMEKALRLAIADGFILDDVDCDSLDKAVAEYMEKARQA